MFRVLVVDDDPDINEALREGLRLAGYQPVAALTGSDALAEVERQLPDLVLLDQMLPDIDGVEVCRRLRAAPRTKEVPIVFCDGALVTRVARARAGGWRGRLRRQAVQHAGAAFAHRGRASPGGARPDEAPARLGAASRPVQGLEPLRRDPLRARRMARLPRAVTQHSAQLRGGAGPRRTPRVDERIAHCRRALGERDGASA